MQNSDKSVISRLIIQKILSSDSMEYIAKESSEKINAAFLSANPEKDLNFFYRLKNTNNSAYYNTIVEVGISWKTDPSEIQDLEGNVWNKCSLVISPTIASSYGSVSEQFLQRAECISQVGNLIKEIKEMVSAPIKVMSLTSEQRIERDRKRKYDLDCGKIIEAVMANKNAIRKNVRIGGVRSFSKEMIASVGTGKFEFEINDGSRRSPRIRKYSVVVPENGTYAHLKRIF